MSTKTDRTKPNQLAAHHWNHITRKQWKNWHWQINHGISSLAELKKVIHLTPSEIKGAKQATKHLKMKISPHIISVMDPDNPNDILRRQFIPSSKEMIDWCNQNLFEDVNADDRYSPVPGLIHRYPTKVLIFPSNYCASYCRYCFRRKLNREQDICLNHKQLNEIVKYIQSKPQIEEVILSGGDPLVLEDEQLDHILSSISSVPNVQILRIHTRLPVTIPYRITPALTKTLAKYKPIYVVIHIDTPREITPPFEQAVSRLVDNGIPCLASCPLLKDINDTEPTLRTLWTELVKLRVKPYYLFHSDPVKGMTHFLVPLERGLEIMRNLYDRMSGLAMPQYCLNVPSGGGHVLLTPDYIKKLSGRRFAITNFEGEQIEFVDQAVSE